MKPRVAPSAATPGKTSKGDEWLNIRVNREFKKRFTEIADWGGCAVSDLGRHACEALIQQGEKDGRLEVRLGRGVLTIELRNGHGKQP